MGTEKRAQGARWGAKDRAATALTYGLVVGLVAIAGISAVTRVGDSVDFLFGSVSSTLSSTVDGDGAAATATPTPTPIPRPASCNDVTGASGIYTLDPDGAGGFDPFEAYCDMSTDDGGWTLVFSYTMDSARTGISGFWSAAHTDGPPATAVRTNSSANAFDRLMAAPGVSGALLLRCETGSTTNEMRIDQPSSVARAVFSPSSSEVVCPPDSSGSGCTQTSVGLGSISRNSGFVSNANQYLADHDLSRMGSYRYRWGTGNGTWNVRFGLDPADDEYDCNDRYSDSNDYWAVFVR